jgi:hypothetical protein
MKPPICHFCGKTEKEHKGLICFGTVGAVAGQNMKGGEKPPRKTPGTQAVAKATRSFEKRGFD